jgi:hypothetical protein
MSYQDARNNANENMQLIGDPMNNPLEWNNAHAILSLATAIERDFRRVQSELDNLQAAVQSLQEVGKNRVLRNICDIYKPGITPAFVPEELRVGLCWPISGYLTIWGRLCPVLRGCRSAASHLGDRDNL